MAQTAGYKGDVYVQTGSSTTETLVPIGTGNGAERDFYLIEQLNDCEATDDFSVTNFDSVATDAVVYKEGTKSIKFDVAAPVATTDYTGTYDPAGTWDWSLRSWFGCWVYSDRASAAYTSARIELSDGVNTSYWDMTFDAATWTRITIDLNGEDGNSGTACDLSAVDSVAWSIVAADGTGFYLDVDWFGPSPGVIGRTVTIKDAGTTCSVNTYKLSASGYLLFDSGSEPAGALTATYDTYDIVQFPQASGWSLDYVADTADTSVFPTQAKAFAIMLDAWNASLDAKLDDTTQMHDQFASELGWRLYRDISTAPYKFRTGWGTLVNLSSGINMTDMVTEGWEIQGTGYLYDHTVDMPTS